LTIQYDRKWPIFVQDRQDRTIYLTQERWEHALAHPGMHNELLDLVLETIRQGKRRQDHYDPAKFKYTRSFLNLPMSYTHVVVVVKFSWQEKEPPIADNFVLTAYLVERW
jgi:hypothetical protein